jgi:DNA-binding MarR family transcriptional regulator
MIATTQLFDSYASLRRAVALEANRVFKDIGLGTRQFIILWSLHKNQRMTVGELVVCAMTDAATVSRSLVQLIKHGYVEKLQCEKDGRVWYVKLTAKGSQLAPEMERLYRQLADRCFAVLQPNEREVLATLLSKVVNNFDAPRTNHPSEQLVKE